MSAEETFHKLLCRQEFSEASLKSLAETIASLEADGFRPTDLFPLGTIAQDGAGVHFEARSENLGDVLRRLSELRDLQPEFRIFPIGIIAPDHFRIETTFGRRSR